MQTIVLDTNCLLMILPSSSPYHKVWEDILEGRISLCVVSPTFFYHLIKADPDDNKFVDCAICAGAELIVTNDAHFNILKTIKFPKVEFMTLQEFSRTK